MKKYNNLDEYAKDIQFAIDNKIVNDTHHIGFVGVLQLIKLIQKEIHNNK